MKKPLIVACPRCGKEHEYNSEDPYRPFCSKRCKDSDLYEWLVAPKDKDDDGEDAGNGGSLFH